MACPSPQHALKRGVWQVETPVLGSQCGGAKARPFLTRSNAINADMVLRIAPELYLKVLLIVMLACWDS